MALSLPFIQILLISSMSTWNALAENTTNATLVTTPMQQANVTEQSFKTSPYGTSEPPASPPTTESPNQANTSETQKSNTPQTMPKNETTSQTSTTTISVTTMTSTTTIAPTTTTLRPEARKLVEEVKGMKKCAFAVCTPENKQTPTHESLKSLCQCDAECGLLGECCPQVAPEQPHWRNLSLPVLGVQRRYWGCGLLRFNTTWNETVSMVTRCPEGHALERLCARDVPKSLYDYKLDLPVLDAASGAWYQNVFCAACYGTHRRLRKQTLFFKCPFPATTQTKASETSNTSNPTSTSNQSNASNTSKTGGISLNIIKPEPTKIPPSPGIGTPKAANSELSNSSRYSSELVRKRRRREDLNDTNSTPVPTTAESHSKSSSDAEEEEESGKNNYTVFKILQEGEYEPGTLSWRAGDGAVCYLTPELGPPDSLNDPEPWERPCQMDMIDRCPATWTDEITAEKCRGYSYHVFVFEVKSTSGQNTSKPKQVYKNPHCAKCYGEKRPLNCMRLSSKRRFNMMSVSLRLIMDYEWDPAREGCGPSGGVWDALHGRCQALDEVCPAESRYTGGRCVAEVLPTPPPRNTTEDSGGPSGRGAALDGEVTCPRIMLDPGEFTLENGTLRLTLVGSAYFGLRLQPDQFTLLEDGRAEVCNEYTPALLPTERVQGYLTAVCLSISAVCLVLHMVIHVLLPKLHNLPGKNLQALSLALFLAQLGFLLGVSPPAQPPAAVCEAVAAAVHFFYLAAFAWMNVMSVDIWRTFSATAGLTLRSRPAVAHRRYAYYAWGAPAAFVAVALIADHTRVLPPRLRPGYAEAGICWFGSGLGLGIYLTAPITAVLLCDIALFAVTVFQLHRRQENSRYLRRRRNAERNETSVASASRAASTATEPTGSSGGGGGGGDAASRVQAHAATGPLDRVRFFLYVKLFIIMGMTWLTGTLATLARWPALWYPFVVLNGLQGTFIFVMFDVKRTVLSMLWERLLGPRPAPALLRPPRPTTTSSSGMGGGGGAGAAERRRCDGAKGGNAPSTEFTSVRSRLSTTSTSEAFDQQNRRSDKNGSALTVDPTYKDDPKNGHVLNATYFAVAPIKSPINDPSAAAATAT